jgi:ribosomal protein S27E
MVLKNSIMEDNKKFQFGDMIIKCHQCGKEQILEELVTDGRAIYLYNVEGNGMKLHCPDCDITMELTIKPSENTPERELENELTLVDTEYEELEEPVEELEEGVTEEYIPYEELQEETTTAKTV